MEENIIGLIAEAEKKAAAKKAQAQSDAAQIIAAAERDAQEILKRSISECAELRENIIKCAEERAASGYERAIEESKATAKTYADSQLDRASDVVLDIVGRLTK